MWHQPSSSCRIVKDEEGKNQINSCVNLGSYNYLGFADDWHKSCKKEVMVAAERYPVSLCTSFAEGGYTALHRQLETSVASFVGKEDAVIFNMGWVRTMRSCSARCFC